MIGPFTLGAVKLSRLGACKASERRSSISQETTSSRWWQLNYFLFSPRTLGKMIQFDEHIFQMGWFNHQLVMLMAHLLDASSRHGGHGATEGLVFSCGQPSRARGWAVAWWVG